jgi:flagellar hook-length control protein FliK
MATSPTTALLGPVAGTGQPASASSAGKRDEAGENSQFSAVFSDATDAAQAVAKDDGRVASNPENLVEAAVARHGRLASAAMPALTDGKVLPSDGEALPLDDVLAAAMGEAVTEVVETAEEVDAEPIADATATATATAVQTALPPVLPETPVHAAIGAQARGPLAAARIDTEADAAIDDATSAQKREVPTPPQTLAGEPAEAVSEDMPVPVAADKTIKLQQPAGASAEAAPAAANADAIAPAFSDRLKSSLSGAPSPSPDARSGSKSAEAAAMVDALKQADASLTATQPTTDAPATVAAVRDAGLRQYMDAAVTGGVRVDVPVGKPGWSEAMTDKVMWMSAQNIASAEIHLNPADLGPLSVRISSHQDQTSVYFTSAHAAVRDALDQSLPRLREMFSGQGIQLLDVGVGDQHAARDQSAQREAFAATTRGRTGESPGAADDGLVVARPSAAMRRVGLLDAYA